MFLESSSGGQPGEDSFFAFINSSSSKLLDF